MINLIGFRTHPAERPRVRGYEPRDDEREALLDTLAADFEAR
jgi:hypothetical protein